MTTATPWETATPDQRQRLIQKVRARLRAEDGARAVRILDDGILDRQPAPAPISIILHLSPDAADKIQECKAVTAAQAEPA
jgi:hypothetical protein